MAQQLLHSMHQNEIGSPVSRLHRFDVKQLTGFLVEYDERFFFGPPLLPGTPHLSA